MQKGVAGAITIIGLLATTVTGAYAAIYLIAPELQPRERLGATIDRVAVEHGVGYAEYRHRMGYTEASDASEQADLSTLGDMVFVRVTLHGFGDRSYIMSVVLLDQENRSKLYAASRPGLTAACENLSPVAEEEGMTWRCWIAHAPPDTRYVIRAELYDAGVTTHLQTGPVGRYPLLDFSESEPQVVPAFDSLMR